MRNFLFPISLVMLLSACQTHNSQKQIQQVDSLRYSYIAQENWIFHPVFDSLQYWHNQWMMQQNTWNTVMDSTERAQLKNEFPMYFALGEKMNVLITQHQTLKTIYDVDLANLSSLQEAIKNGASQDIEGKPIDEQYWENAIRNQIEHQDSVNKITQAQIQSANIWVEQTKLMYPLFQNKIKDKE